MTCKMTDIAAELFFPEGPVFLPNGDVLVVELGAGTLTRITPSAGTSVVAHLGGGPNGAAIGPDGWVYVCNNGGNEWARDPEHGVRPAGQARDYSGGRIERVNPDTGDFEVLYTGTEEGPLSGPNDIVFDRQGGFWFTDIGKNRPRDMDRGGVYYASADGTMIRQAIYPVMQPNGIALSPEEDRLYVSETVTGRVLVFDLAAPGEPILQPWPAPSGGQVMLTMPGFQMFDSMAMEADGNLCVATLMSGQVTTISPDGRIVEETGFGDLFTSNICFGGPDFRTAYVTLSATGRVVSLPWPRAGLPPNFHNRRP
ncbi:gluconolaconase [Roseovarius sp. HI0049]|nr:gluconolaconase [Roseovarius sp. HI0049]